MSEQQSQHSNRDGSAFDAWAKLTQTGMFERKLADTTRRSNSNAFGELRAHCPRRMFAFLRSSRDARPGDRILDRAVKGVSLERFRSALERESCHVDSVDISEDRQTVIVEFTYLADGGYCAAVLTDLQSNGTYVRACFVAQFSVDVDPWALNELNKLSKFLRFYVVDDGRLFIEHSVLLIDLLDSSIAANIDLFHGAVRFIAHKGFTYAALPAARRETSDVVRDEAAGPKFADISRSDLRGPGGDLQAVISRLEDIRSVLRDIAKNTA